jgi:hypothetical protein
MTMLDHNLQQTQGLQTTALITSRSTPATSPGAQVRSQSTAPCSQTAIKQILHHPTTMKATILVSQSPRVHPFLFQAGTISSTIP